ncbi:MAG: tRNA 4-thiouridine(8) synthase ThiI [Firmicutes bacterium]|nr:tRNA 4-thiouridine(8) synthase ThiI [Bacillota bacterium]
MDDNKQLLLIRYGELGLKGKNKNLFIAKLAANIRASLRGLHGWQVRTGWGRLWVEVEKSQYDEAVDRLTKVFGIYSLSPVIRVEKEMDDLAAAAWQVLMNSLPEGGTFKVETRRTDKTYPLTSPEISRAVAGELFRRLAGDQRWDAEMRDPQVTVNLEVREDGAYVYGETIRCAGGLPVSCSGKALLLLSGGIDSPVAGWMAMKRGVAIEGIHFESYPFTSERAKDKVFELCKILAKWQSAPVKLHVVHFTEIQKAIYASCREEYGITLMRRMMFRLAERVAKDRRCLALYTGESVGQVASQTLESMQVINDVVNIPVLRPLVGMDKEDIMAVAKRIGTFETSILPYEDCCTVFLPKYPKIRPLKGEAEKLEEALDIEGLLEDALSKTETVKIGEFGVIHSQPDVL